MCCIELRESINVNEEVLGVLYVMPVTTIMRSLLGLVIEPARLVL